MINPTEEYITCAAIWYKNLPTQNLLPKNLESGVVVCGHRHGDCISTLKTISGLRSVQNGPDSVGDYIQGFMTSKNRFVDRITAMQIAINCGQVDRRNLHNKMIGLFSEDIY